MYTNNAVFTSRNEISQTTDTFFIIIRAIVLTITIYYILAYMQEIGRADRDGLHSEACLYYNNNDIGQNMTNLKPEIRQFCKLTSCRRKFLSEHFGFDHVPFDQLHGCCDICEQSCLCDDCVASSVDSIVLNVSVEDKGSMSDIEDLQCILTQYFEAENTTIDVPVASAFTGLTIDLASKISRSYKAIKSVEDLLQLCSNIDKKYIANILDIIQHYCSTITK